MCVCIIHTHTHTHTQELLRRIAEDFDADSVEVGEGGASFFSPFKRARTSLSGPSIGGGGVGGRGVGGGGDGERGVTGPWLQPGEVRGDGEGEVEKGAEEGWEDEEEEESSAECVVCGSRSETKKKIALAFSFNVCSPSKLNPKHCRVYAARMLLCEICIYIYIYIYIYTHTYIHIYI